MKTKIARLLGVGLSIALLTSLMVAAIPAQGADPLIWNTEYGPSTSSTKNTLLSGSDVVDIAVGADGTTIWAVTGTAAAGGNRTLKSTDGGKYWVRKTFSAVSKDLVAIAPDDADIVAVVDQTTPAVWITTNGGTTWSQLTGVTIGTINAITISPASAGTHYVAIGGATGGDDQINYYSLGASVPAWKVATATTDSWAITSLAATTNISALAFSPNFASDKVMLAVTVTGTTQINLEIASFAFKKWNSNAGFTSYPATIVSNGTVAPADNVSLTLSPTYLGADSTERVCFVGLDYSTVNSTGKGLLRRYKDYTGKTLKADTPISSVAYDGTNLVAGNGDSNTVYRCANSLATTPDVYSTSTYQKPGGAAVAAVAWAGEDVVAGTTGANSAFAVSGDNGKTFNDLSLIDTSITNITDIAYPADASKKYQVSNDGSTYTNVFRYASRWERILSLTNTDTHLIRLAPEDSNYIYLVDTSANAKLYYSSDGGELKWNLRALPATAVDLTVESAEVAYALKSTGSVYKTTNGGFIWGTARSTSLGDGSSIVGLGEDKLLVAGSSGAVAYSTDGNASSSTWKKPSTTAPFSSGEVQVAASGLDSGDIIYVVSEADGSVKRWTIGTSTVWKAMGSVSGTPSGAQMVGGTLYIMSSNGTDSWITRSLTPSYQTSSSYYSNVTTSANFSRTPRALKITSGSNKIWAITNGDPSSDGMRSLIDEVSVSGPTATGPADGAVIKVNPVTGNSHDVVFSWDRISTKASTYQIDISYDSAFKEDVLASQAVGTSYGSKEVATIGPSGGTATVSFQPGSTYYWRVRLSSPLFSPYSEARSFTVEGVTTFDVSGPAVGATDVSTTPTLVWSEYPGAIDYEVELSDEPEFTVPLISQSTTNTFYKVTESLAYETTYYWRARGVTGEWIPKQQREGGPWVTGVFTTMAEPTEPTTTEPVIITQPGTPPPAQIIEVPVATPVIPAYLLWTIIVIGAVLVIAVIVLIVRTRRVT